MPMKLLLQIGIFLGFESISTNLKLNAFPLSPAFYLSFLCR